MGNLAIKMTAEEFLRFSSSSDFRHELVEGEVYSMSPAGIQHGRIENKLLFLLNAFVIPRQLGQLLPGDTGFILQRNPDTVRSPDIGFIARNRYEVLVSDSGYVAGPPDLAVEILSPSDRFSETEEKIQEYLDCGTRLAWMVDPFQAAVTVFQPQKPQVILTAQEDLTGEAVLPGFRCKVAEIFEF